MKIGIIGLGYVGLPLAMEFAQHFEVIGFDIKDKRVQELRQGIDLNNEFTPEDFKEKNILFTSSLDDIKDLSLYIITVPTPIDEHQNPDLRAVRGASEMVGKLLRPGDTVVYESTVYPGCTEEVCVPILESVSGLKLNRDFNVGYSPERINPGDKVHTTSKIVKVVSASNPETLEKLADIYGTIIEAGIHKAPSIKVAEAAKVIENTQRDLNIALMNELSIIFHKMDINTYDVIEAAATKWNFIKFFPGLVGGHCIGVDPYYLTYKAKELGHYPKVILAGREINDSMHVFVVRELIRAIPHKEKPLKDLSILVLGVTYKANVPDSRNSKVADLIREIQGYDMQVDAFDPVVIKEEFEEEYGLSLSSWNDIARKQYDAVILAVPHRQLIEKPLSFYLERFNDSGLLMDFQGVYRDAPRPASIHYWMM